MFCTKCGSENLEYAKFCKDCGERFFQNQSRFNSLSISKKNFTKKQKITTYVFGIVAIMIIVIGVIIYLNTGTRLAAKQVEDGKRHLASKQFNDSIQDFEKAIKTDKNTPQAYIGLADAYIGLDNDQKAEENLQNGIKASPESDGLYIKLADMYSDEGKTEEAVQILKDRSNTAKTQNIQTQIEKLKSTINTYGNTQGNIMNSGLVAGQGNWLYYSNSSDNWNLYKIRADGSEKEKLNNEISSRINVAGDWIYYTDKNMKLYRMRTDATKIPYWMMTLL